MLLWSGRSVEDKLGLIIAAVVVFLAIVTLKKIALNRKGKQEELSIHAKAHRGKVFYYDEQLLFNKSIRIGSVSIEIGFSFQNRIKVAVTRLTPSGDGLGYYQTVIEVDQQETKDNFIISANPLMPLFVNTNLFPEEYEFNGYVVYSSNWRGEKAKFIKRILPLVAEGYTVVVSCSQICVYQPERVLTREQITQVVDCLKG